MFSSLYCVGEHTLNGFTFLTVLRRNIVTVLAYISEAVCL